MSLPLPKLTLRIEDITRRGQRAENLITGRDDSLEVEGLEWKLYQHLIQTILLFLLMSFVGRLLQ